MQTTHLNYAKIPQQVGEIIGKILGLRCFRGQFYRRHYSLHTRNKLESSANGIYYLCDFYLTRLGFYGSTWNPTWLRKFEQN